MKKSLITLAIGTIAATALLGACGDDDKSSDGGSDITAAGGDTSSEGGSSDTAAAGGDDIATYCAKLEAFEVATDAADFTLAAPTADALRTAFEKIDPLLEAMQANPPAEVAADVDTLAVPLLGIIDLLRSYDWDADAASTDPEYAALGAEINSAESVDAETRMNAWALDKCGLDIAD